MAGRVVGVVGRMGSGKSYFAVRMAYKRLMAGCNVSSNFTMRGLPEGAGTWQHFKGWDDFAELEGEYVESKGRMVLRKPMVVFIDEAHLYAPSSQSLVFPQVARFKLSQARKFGLDVFWITQHEDRVNRTLKDLTNMIYVCNAWFDHLAFSAKGYEPERLRRKDQH